jgi:hypothetical protein
LAWRFSSRSRRAWLAHRALAFRLCGAEIPNVERIIACMKANKTNLSPGGRSVFDKTSFLPRLAPIS